MKVVKDEMRKIQEKRELHITGLKLSLGFAIFFILTIAPFNSAYAQVAIEVQIREAARDLEPAARAEFIELIRNPEELGVTFKELGVPREVVERVQDVVPKAEIFVEKSDRREKIEKDTVKYQKLEKQSEKLEKVSRKLDKIDSKIEKKVSNIRDVQVRKIDRANIKSLRKAKKVLRKTAPKKPKGIGKGKLKGPKGSSTSSSSSTQGQGQGKGKGGK